MTKQTNVYNMKADKNHVSLKKKKMFLLRAETDESPSNEL